MEGLIFLPIGFYVYPGAIRAVSFNAGTYYQWPIYEGLMWGGVLTAFCCLRYFTDDRGRTIVERGLDHVRGGFAKAATHPLPGDLRRRERMLLLLLQPPGAMDRHARRPVARRCPTKRSYLNGGICGDGTDHPCPNPVLPMPTKRSGYINTDGQLVLPEGAEASEHAFRSNKASEVLTSGLPPVQSPRRHRSIEQSAMRWRSLAPRPAGVCRCC